MWTQEEVNALAELYANEQRRGRWTGRAMHPVSLNELDADSRDEALRWARLTIRKDSEHPLVRAVLQA